MCPYNKKRCILLAEIFLSCANHSHESYLQISIYKLTKYKTSKAVRRKRKSLEKKKKTHPFFPFKRRSLFPSVKLKVNPKSIVTFGHEQTQRDKRQMDPVEDGHGDGRTWAGQGREGSSTWWREEWNHLLVIRRPTLAQEYGKIKFTIADAWSWKHGVWRCTVVDVTLSGRCDVIQRGLVMTYEALVRCQTYRRQSYFSGGDMAVGRGGGRVAMMKCPWRVDLGETDIFQWWWLCSWSWSLS